MRSPFGDAGPEAGLRNGGGTWRSGARRPTTIKLVRRPVPRVPVDAAGVAGNRRDRSSF